MELRAVTETSLPYSGTCVLSVVCGACMSLVEEKVTAGWCHITLCVDPTVLTWTSEEMAALLDGFI